MKSLYTICIGLMLTSLLGPAAYSQSVDGRFVSGFTDPGTYEVILQLNASGPVQQLAQSTLRFTFDPAGLTFPASPVATTDYEFVNYNGFDAPSGTFYTNTVTNTAGIITISGDLAAGPGLDLPNAWTDFVRFFFTITDDTQFSGLAWTQTEVFYAPGGSADEYMINIFADRNEPIDSPLPVVLDNEGAADRQVNAFELSSVYPNPFDSRASLTLQVSDSQPVKIDVYNLLGQQVLTVFDGDMASGQSVRLAIDGSDLSSGIYLVRVAGRNFVETQKVTVLK